MIQNNLKDVKCEKCQRVIGQRGQNVFYQAGMVVSFNRSADIYCHFIGCRHKQIFKVNRETSLNLLQESLAVVVK